MCFSWVLDFGGDIWNSRLTTNVPPVLSELSRRLSRWWREEELDGRVSDVFETLPDSARLRELDPPEELGQSRSLSLRSLLWPSRRVDWCLGDSPCLRLRSGVRDLRWPDPWELGRSAAETLEATDLGCYELATVLDRLVLDDSSDLGRLVGKACLGACNSTESSIISVSFLAAFAAAGTLRRFLCAVALACAVHASGSQSWHTRQGLSWVQRGKPTFKRHCWQRRWLSFLRRKWEHSGNFGCDSKMQRCKQTALKHETYLTRKTQPGTNWRVFWQSITLLSSSSKTPGKATGSVSDWTHVRSLARRKSKWTIGGCGALRRCGCARMYEGTQFLCVKFCLGSAGEPTICSHCYDVLNEDRH